MRSIWTALLLLGLAAEAPAIAQSVDLDPGPHDAIIDGVRLWYRVAGQSSGIPVVYLHGGPGQGSQAFATLAGPALEPSLRMVYLDQRGSGRSERPWTNAYSIDLLVDDLEQLRARWNVPRIALVGHSFGTIVALEYAARHPDRVAAMVLTAAVPDLPAALDIQCERIAATDPEAFRRAAAETAEGARPRCNPFAAYPGDAMRLAVEGNMFPDPSVRIRVEEAETAGGLRNTGELTGAIFSANLLAYRFEQLERLTMPVLVIAGAEDQQAVSEPQRSFVSRLRNGRYIEYPRAGHFMWAEDPARFARDVAAFINAVGR